MASSRGSLIDGNWFYDDPSGALHVGWLKLGNTWYYFDSASCEMKTGLIDVGDMRYFALDSGAMATSDWVFFGAGCALASASGVLYETFQSSDGAPLLAHTDSLPGPVHVGDSVFFADEECRWRSLSNCRRAEPFPLEWRTR